MHEHESHQHPSHGSAKRMAASATLHCLIGCAVGELTGVTIGTTFGFASRDTIILAFILSFISGYSVSTIPIMKAGVPFIKSLKLVLAADTVSILTMTIVDNIIMLTVPGAMHKNLANPIYWESRIISLTAAFITAYPVNIYLLKHGKGHALTHKYHRM